MSDTDIDYGPDDPSDFILRDQRRVMGTALAGLDDDPEQASRSMELGKATGDSPALIYPNLENYEAQHKAALTAELLKSNKYLRQYVDADPMHAKLSGDDYANLDAASEAISKLTLPSRMLNRGIDAVTTGLGEVSGSIAQGAISGYRKGAIEGGGIGDWAFLAPDAKDHPLSAALQGVGWASFEIGSRFISGTIQGVTEAAHEGAKQLAIQLGSSEAGAEHFAREMAALAEAEVTGLSGRHGMHVAEPSATGEPQPFKPTGPLAKVQEMATAAKPWLDEGLEPPAGLHPEIDKLKADQNSLDVDNLDEALKTSVASATRERAPDVYRDFVRNHTNADIGISGDRIAALYGDKAPALDDGLLGWVPGIEAQLEAAKATGEDVKVPAADWLAKVDPEVAKELHDDIRVRPGGITKAEVEAKAEAKEGLEEAPKPLLPLPESLSQVRAAAGLEPMFSVGDRKLELKEIQLPNKGWGRPDLGSSFHDFDLLDENGSKRGSLSLSRQQEGKQLYVEMIQGGGTAKMYDPNFFGPALMRDLLRQIKEQFPDAESITGHRVSGAREKAGSYELKSAMPVIKLNLDHLPFEEAEKLRDIFRGTLEPAGLGVSSYTKPTELYTQHQQELIKATDELLSRIVPTAEFKPSAGIERPGQPGKATGMYMMYKDDVPKIFVSMVSNDPIGVGRHEAIHHLRQYGFFKPEEWATLERAARDLDWQKYFNVDKRYPHLGQAAKLEEAIADGFRYWNKGGEVPDKLHPIFQKLKEFFDTLKAKFKEILGVEPTWEELFGKVESGEVGGREGAEPLDARAYRESVEDNPNRKSELQLIYPEWKKLKHRLDIGDITDKELDRLDVLNKKVLGRANDNVKFSVDDEVPFDRGTIMSKDHFDRYMKLISDRHAEDLASATKRATAEQAKRQGKEWKENEASVREEVSRDIHQRPDVAADLFLGSGEYLGEKIGQRPKLDAGALSAEQKAALPKDYYAKDGMNPDDVANLFGYPSGDAMVQKLGEYNAAKLAANMSAKDFVSRVVDMETERQMQARFGSLDKSILDEAKDQATSETQLNLLHEEVLALALQNKATGKIDQATLRGWVRDKFAELPIGGVKLDDYLAAAGRAGRTAEAALLREDYAEAFRAKQQQYLAMQFAAEAKKLEKAKDQFDKLAKRYSKREVTGASPEYTDAVHDILQRLGERVRRSVQDVQESYKLNGYNGLRDFVDNKQAQLRDLHTPDFVLDDAFRKPTADLTTEEFTQVHDALKAITHNSRDELKVERAGEKHDLDEVLNQMIDKMKSLGEPKPHPREEGPITRQIKNYWWGGITVESMLNRLDRDDPRGVFYQYITHHFTEASNYKDRLIKDFQKKVSALGKIEGMDKQVANDLFKNPDTGEALLLRRRNVLGILQNAGNKNNLMKLAKGYGLEPNQVLDWLHQHTTKDDWDRAQKIGDIFNEVFDMANTMSHTISGVGIQRLPLEAIDTPHGQYPGWYNPIKYDPFIPGKSKKLMGPQAIEDEGFYRATTPQGYTKERTGYIAPVDLSLDIVPQRMKQMLHDIAMRPAILQLSKFFYDNRFERAMTNFYGAHQAKEMIPFLRDIANAPNFKSWSQQLGNEGLEYLRQNTIATLIGFNPGTVMKHGATAWINSMTEVGAKNYLREFKNITAETMTGRADWRMAMEKSEELQRRSRNFAELIEGHGSEINLRGARSTFMSLRDMVTSAGATPVSISDLLSAVPTWLAEYKDQLAQGSDEGMAVSLANRAVRRAHGSAVQSNKPSLARNPTSAIGAYMSSLYGFFSHMQQKQYEMAWKARDLAKGEEGATRHIPDLMQGMFSYIIAPAVIEELVTPTTNTEHESWGYKAASTLAMGVSSSFIGIRDFVRAAINVRDPQAGLLGTTLKTGTDLARDLSKGPQAFTKDKAGNLIKHTFALGGVLTGLTNEQEGKLAEYMYRYSKGLEKPKGLWDAAVGARYGTNEKHSRSFEQWKNQTLGGR